MSDWEIDIRQCERKDNERKYHYFSQLQINGVIAPFTGEFLKR